MNVIAIRHGETDENLAGIIQGQTHGNLNPVGIEQARQAGLTLQSESFDAFVSSDLKRCIDTLEAIQAFHPAVPVSYTDQLREYSYGIFTGLSTDSVEVDPKDSDDIDYKVEGGESTREVRGRVAACLNELYSKYPNGTVLLVTHGGPIRVLRWLLGGVDFNERHKEPIGNCSIWRFEMSAAVGQE